MPKREALPPGYDELGRGSSLIDELPFEDGEMLKIAEHGVDCFKVALADSKNLLSERMTLRQIPHLNGLRNPAVLLALKGNKISSLDITIPRKDEDLAIVIEARDEINPNRYYKFSEITDPNSDDYGGFEIGDSDWRNAELAERGVDGFMDKSEVATWLYLQAGVEYDDIQRKLKQETDPVQDAALALSIRAKNIETSRIVRTTVADGLTFFGEEIAVQSPDTLALQHEEYPRQGNVPKAFPVRLYNVWTTTVFDTDAYGGVRERLTCTFSPDNPALLVPNPRSGLGLSIETTKTLSPYEMSLLYAERSAHYQGQVSRLFESIAEGLRQKIAS